MVKINVIDCVCNSPKLTSQPICTCLLQLLRNGAFLFILFVKGHSILVNTILGFQSLSVTTRRVPTNSPFSTHPLSLSLPVFVSVCIIAASCRRRRTGRRTSGRTSAVTQTMQPVGPGASPPTQSSASRAVASANAPRVGRLVMLQPYLSHFVKYSRVK